MSRAIEGRIRRVEQRTPTDIPAPTFAIRFVDPVTRRRSRAYSVDDLVSRNGAKLNWSDDYANDSAPT